MDQTESKSFLKRGDLMDCIPYLMVYKKNGNFCDVTLKVENKEIHAHRNILSMTIPYFETMFLSSFRERSERIIEMRGIDPEVLENLVDLSYGSEIQVTSSNVKNLLMGADFLLMSHVTSKLKEFFKSHLTLQNVWEAKITGEKLNCKELIAVADEFIDENFSAFSETDDFLELGADELLAIIQRPELRVCEERVLEAAVKWIKFSVFDRASFLTQALSHVKTNLLSARYIFQFIRNEVLVRTSPECKELLERALISQMMSGNTQSYGRTRCSSVIYLIGGRSSAESDPISDIQTYKPEENKWTILKNIGRALTCAASTVCDRKIYVFGGT